MKILHMFDWPFKDIIPMVKVVKEQGFDAIQISPVTGTKEKGWRMLYQPTNFEVGNYLGTREDVQEIIKEADKYGIKIIVDVVLRHVAGDEHEHLKPHRLVDSKLLHYLAEPIEAHNIDGDRFQCTRRCTGTPMLDYDNPGLQMLYTNFLDELVRMGVWGFRLDQLKHYALPDEGSTVLHVFAQYNFYGEIINTPKYILDKYTRYMKVLTDGRPSDYSKLVAKFETHDDYLEFKSTCRMNDKMRLKEWDVLVNELIYSDSLYYTRPFETLWMSPEIREINKRN